MPVDGSPHRASPNQRDQPEGQLDAIVAVDSEPGSAVGHPTHGAEQAELVSRALRIGQDDVPEKWHGSHAVVGQAQDPARLRHARSTEAVGRRHRLQDLHPMIAGETCDLRQVGRERTASVVRIVAGRHRQNAARAQQGDNLPEGARSLRRAHVLPDGVQTDHVG